MMRLLYFLFWLAAAGTVYFLPDAFTDRYFTSGQLWACGLAGVAGMVLAYGKGVRCPRGVVALGVVLLAVWGYGFGEGYLGWQALAVCGALWLLALVAGSAGKEVAYRDVYFVLALSLGVEAAIGIGQFAGLWRGGGQFRVVGTFDNPAGLAAYAAACFPGALYFLGVREWWGRVLGWSVSVLAVVAVGLSESRAGLVALAATGMLYVAGSRKWEWRMVRRWGAVVAVAGVLAGWGLYLWKQDSADGRLLVWRCTAEMMADAPVTGHAPGSFQAKYMDYQAAFLEGHPGERWGWLADNVKHPFNEYLKVGAECGVMGLLAVAVGLWWLWHAGRWGGRERRPLFLGVAGIALCSLFSYPLNYPGVQVLLCVLLGLIGRGEKEVRWRGVGVWMGVIVAALALAGFAVYWGRAEVRWKQLSGEALRGGFEEAEKGYRELYPFLKENALFLYNYGAELHHAGRWTESREVMEECERRLNDTDVQMLLGDNCERVGDDAEAERHFRQAAAMCPVRFVPPYRLMKLYERTGRHKEACLLAIELVEKPVKVPSYTVEKIKRECREMAGD